MADGLEALIGAIYLDSNLDACRECIFKWYGHRLDELSEMHPAKDAKSHLQEWVQAHKFPLPTYTATVSGKPHEQTFVVTCQVEGCRTLHPAPVLAAEKRSNWRREIIWIYYHDT